MMSSSASMEEILFEVASPHYYGHSLSLPMHLCGPSFSELVAAFRTDAGVAYTSYGEEFTEFVAVSHTRMYQTQAKTWLNDKALEDIRFVNRKQRKSLLSWFTALSSMPREAVCWTLAVGMA